MKERSITQDEMMVEAIRNAVQSHERRQRVSLVTVYSFLLPIIAGLGVLAFGVTWGIKSWNAPTGHQQTQGMVVAIEGGGKYPFIPVVEYQVDGKTYKTSGSVSVRLSRLSIGEPVTVLYSPGNPQHGEVYSFGEMWGFIDRTGKEVIAPKYDQSSKFSEGLASVMLNGKWGYIDKGDNFIIPPAYDQVYDFSEGLAWVKKGNKFSCKDRTGKELIPIKFDDAGAFASGLASVKLGGKCGYIDRTGKVIIPLKYEDLQVDLYNELILVTLNGREGFVGRDGTEYFGN